MSDAIIGGAIAAVIGAAGYAIIGLWLEHRREKAKQLAIVEALIIETAENLTICTTPVTRKMWWMAPFKLEIYQAYKGQLLFLRQEVRTQLVIAVFTMEGAKRGMEIHVSKVPYSKLVREEPLPLVPELIEQLKFVNNELRKWREKHTRCRLFSLVSAVCRRLRNFPLKIRRNLGLRHT